MERRFHRLLLSYDASQVKLGYLSIIFWGFFSGQDGIIRSQRAMGMVNLAIRHLQRSRIDSAVIARRVWSARASLSKGRCGEAIASLLPLPMLGFAFASKVCAFLSPQRCGVIDSVIVARYPRFGFAADRKGYVTKEMANRGCYQKYCVFLARRASWLNRSGAHLRWRDRDGRRHAWRAVDVERALY